MEIQFIHYPACSTCKKAQKWLKENHVKFSERNITTENPTVEELEQWIQKTGLPLNKFFNTSGRLYKELHFKDKLKTLELKEIISLLASNGMLIKRPLLITDNFILVGFKEEEWKQNLIS
ncbi:arsenate reductase family protein [uncultured Apibacter sp.]|uniref:arsenate reductase family protein n=1 Tax=uncultured Apibacter sp. TaxID=1778616 RepID=UPI0025DCFE7A|nr:arsenate reductase family protein [uncultured Apibacter sp.]